MEQLKTPFDFVEDNQRPITQVIADWSDLISKSVKEDLVMLHEGQWFDPHVMAAADEYTMHILVLTGKLWPTHVYVNTVSVKQDSDEDSAWEDIAPAPVLSNELSWLRGILPTLRGNVKSQVRCSLRALELALPHVNKGNYILQREFFAEVGRLTRLVIRWKNKQGNYNDVLKQRFIYLDTVMQKLTGKQADRMRMSLYYAADQKHKAVVGKAVKAWIEGGLNQPLWFPPAGTDKGELNSDGTVDISFKFNPDYGKVTDVKTDAGSGGI